MRKNRFPRQIKYGVENNNTYDDLEKKPGKYRFPGKINMGLKIETLTMILSRNHGSTDFLAK